MYSRSSDQLVLIDSFGFVSILCVGSMYGRVGAEKVNGMAAVLIGDGIGRDDPSHELGVRMRYWYLYRMVWTRSVV